MMLLYHILEKSQVRALRLLKNKSENPDLGWQFGVIITEHSHLQGGYSHGQGALQEAADWFILWGVDL